MSFNTEPLSKDCAKTLAGNNPLKIDTSLISRRTDLISLYEVLSEILPGNGSYQLISNPVGWFLLVRGALVCVRSLVFYMTCVSHERSPGRGLAGAVLISILI